MAEDTAKFEAFVKYDFEHDEKFQSGLSSILSKSSGEPDKETIDRAKWFYYTKYVENLDLAKFEAWQKSEKQKEKDNDQTKAEEIKDEQNSQPQRFSFQELVEMIEKGVEIPGIRQIPNKINEGTPSEPKLPVRQKPWEARK